ncbi:MAG TPA: hypothetical protein VE177_06895, partial [Candidatus Binatus sp.]|nr:hypothetical protein [Candidatus Binatus sp.]
MFDSRFRRPILFLFVLSPAIGELLSGSSPPLAFFNPLAFLLLCSLYGSGALLVRDYARRWHKGWYSILFLGAAYGIIEEGIMVRSFFNPGWKDLGLLGSYGRWIGVNWVWAEWLTIYHAIFSITLPILLVELTHPASRSEVWLSSRQRWLFRGLFIFAVLLGFPAFPYEAPVTGLIGCLIAAVLLAWVSKRIAPMTMTIARLGTSTLRLILTGVSVPLVMFFFFTGFAPTFISWPAVAMILGLVIVFGYERLLKGWAANGLNESQRLNLAFGALGFFIGLSPILELKGALGMTFVGAGFFFLLYRLRRRIMVRGLANPAFTSNQPL